MSEAVCCICGKTNNAKEMVRLKDGFICKECFAQIAGMISTRNARFLGGKSKVNYAPPFVQIRNTPVAAVKEMYEYQEERRKAYPTFDCKKSMFDGCLELDDEEQLFRIVNKDSHTANGISSEFVFPYSAVKGYHYEMVYAIRETINSDGSSSKYISYSNENAIVIEIDDKFVKEEIFTPETIRLPGIFSNDGKANIKRAEEILESLKEVFGKPITPRKKLKNRYRTL